MRQIEMMVSTILRLLSLEASRDSALPEESRQSGPGDRKSDSKDRESDSGDPQNDSEDRQRDSGRWEEELDRLLRQGQLGRAEDLLFEHLAPEDRGALSAALDFYRRANALTDAELEARDFTREELLEGLTEVSKRYGLCLPGFGDGPI